jgi:hypothetical protein
MKTANLIFLAFLLPCAVSAGEILAIDSPVGNSCPSLSRAIISPKHRIYRQLNREYYKLSRPGNVRKLSGGTIAPDPNGKITSLIKVGDYGVANWTKEQQVAVFFKKNELVLWGSRMVGYFEQPCINCQDDAAAVESLEKIFPENADIICINKLYAENQHRISNKAEFYKQ